MKHTILALAFCFLTLTSAGAARPNIIFILVDDMGWTGLSHPSDNRQSKSRSDFYQTPNIAKLASQGVTFSDAYAPAPMCSPSRASFLTGKSPAQLHLTSPGKGGRMQDWMKVTPANNINALPSEEITIAELLKKEGYSTAHFGKWHLHSGGPGQHGFDQHDGDSANEPLTKTTTDNPKDIFGITTRAISFMSDQAKAKKTFYLQLSHFALHSPIESTTDSQKAFSKTPKGTHHSRTDYAAMTKDFDDSVGKLLEAVKNLGLEKNTYILFTSDNGAGNKPRGQENAPLTSGKGSLWEGGIRVPMIISGPGIAENQNCHEPVIGSDFFSTVCDLTSVKTPLPKGIEGVSLTPLLFGKQAEFKRHTPYLTFHFPHYGRGPKQIPQSAIRVGNFKLIKDYDSGSIQLFDLSSDLGESKDLSTQMPEKAKKLHTQLNAELKRINAQTITPNPNYDPKAVRERKAR